MAAKKNRRQGDQTKAAAGRKLARREPNTRKPKGRLAPCWRVNRHGLSWGTYYHIEKERLGNCRGLLSEWFCHLATKDWFEVDDFIPAFRDALDQHQVEYQFDIDLSIYHARREHARNQLTEAIKRRLYPQRKEPRHGILSSAEFIGRYEMAEAEIERLWKKHERMQKVKP